MMSSITAQELAKATRLTVVDHTTGGQGRVFEKNDLDIELQLQDNGYTLKVFVKDRGVALL